MAAPPALHGRRAKRWQPYFTPLSFKVGWGHRPATMAVAESLPAKARPMGQQQMVGRATLGLAPASHSALLTHGIGVSH